MVKRKMPTPNTKLQWGRTVDSSSLGHRRKKKKKSCVIKEQLELKERVKWWGTCRTLHMVRGAGKCHCLCSFTLNAQIGEDLDTLASLTAGTQQDPDIPGHRQKSHSLKEVEQKKNSARGITGMFSLLRQVNALHMLPSQHRQEHSMGTLSSQQPQPLALWSQPTPALTIPLSLPPPELQTSCQGGLSMIHAKAVESVHYSYSHFVTVTQVRNTPGYDNPTFTSALDLLGHWAEHLRTSQSIHTCYMSSAKVPPTLHEPPQTSWLGPPTLQPSHKGIPCA